ncbi:MAG TPA: hypothetical protein VLI72_14530 [Methylibium sp.]|nr:hypothetical protein [Methylibium sp.]
MGIGRTELAAGIRKHGFRRWYERELISSHAHLVLTFLSMIGLLGGFEVYDRGAPLGEQFNAVAAVLASAGIGVWALRRYLYLLLHAEATAHQAVCPQCQAYARFDLAAEQPRADAVTVRCRGCRCEWTIER